MWSGKISTVPGVKMNSQTLRSNIRACPAAAAAAAAPPHTSPQCPNTHSNLISAAKRGNPLRPRQELSAGPSATQLCHKPICSSCPLPQPSLATLDTPQRPSDITCCLWSGQSVLGSKDPQLGSPGVGQAGCINP